MPLLALLQGESGQLDVWNTLDAFNIDSLSSNDVITWWIMFAKLTFNTFVSLNPDPC